MLNFRTNTDNYNKGFSVSVGVSAGYLYSQRNKQASENGGVLMGVKFLRPSDRVARAPIDALATFRGMSVACVNSAAAWLRVVADAVSGRRGLLRARRGAAL